MTTCKDTQDLTFSYEKYYIFDVISEFHFLPPFKPIRKPYTLDICPLYFYQSFESPWAYGVMS